MPENLALEDVSSEKSVSWGGEGFIVVMEDEQVIREIAEERLLLLGYTVKTCSNGEKLIALYESVMDEGGNPDAVIMDLTIPGRMGGLEAVSKILVIDPSAKL